MVSNNNKNSGPPPRTMASGKLTVLLAWAFGCIMGSAYTRILMTMSQIERSEPHRTALNDSPFCSCMTKKRPLQVFSLITEMRAGWSNLAVPHVLKKEAHNSRALVVDVGLNQGGEFFYAIQQGFEVVGFEPDRNGFNAVAKKCEALPQCHVIRDVANCTLPLRRDPGQSYVINAAVGEKRGWVELFGSGLVASAAAPAFSNKRGTNVTVVSIDEVIQEDVYLFKIDTQGFEDFVLRGASRLFRDYVVRQLIFEVEPLEMHILGVDFVEMLQRVQDYGFACFSVLPERAVHSENATEYYSAISAGMEVAKKRKRWYAETWDDFVCVNVDRANNGPVLQVAE